LFLKLGAQQFTTGRNYTLSFLRIDEFPQRNIAHAVLDKKPGAGQQHKFRVTLE
jgi:hypothetical protein